MRPPRFHLYTLMLAVAAVAGASAVREWRSSDDLRLAWLVNKDRARDAMYGAPDRALPVAVTGLAILLAPMGWMASSRVLAPHLSRIGRSLHEWLYGPTKPH